tara:strand:- start:918 stop:2060 length:1143 start_codon:yes stop_codon:yes gene_type:complete
MFTYCINRKFKQNGNEIGSHARFFKDFLKDKKEFIDMNDSDELDLYDFSNSVKKSRIKNIVNFCYRIGKKDKLELIIPEKYTPLYYIFDKNNIRLPRSFEDNDIWFIKSVGSSCGRGIRVRRNIERHMYKKHRKIKDRRMKEFCEEYVIQKQILSPLINGRIWTLRHNIVVFKENDGTINLWIHKNGAVKLGIDEYNDHDTSQTKLLDMLLTNSDYKNERQKGGKKIPKESWAMPFVSYEHYEKLFTKMTIMYKEIFPKLIEYSKQFDKQYPNLNASFNEELDLSGNSCYQLLGVDLIFDRNDNPYIIEINDGPQVNYKSGVYHNFLDGEIGGKEWRGEMLNDIIELFIKAPLEKYKYDLPTLQIPGNRSFIKIGTTSDM